KKPSERMYNKLVICRPIVPVGRDLGYLPGMESEKLAPWMVPIEDCLDFLLGGDRDYLDLLVDNGTIEIQALTYIRGRTLKNAFVLIDESQNLSVHETKTLLTRAGDRTKMVLTGDVEQVDDAKLDPRSNGLTNVAAAFGAYSLAGHVTLLKGERSELATLAAKIL